MNRNFINKTFNRFMRHFSGWSLPIVACIALLGLGIIGYAIDMSNRPSKVNPESFTPLLNLIGKIESNDNYNAYFGNSANKDIDFTSMPIAEVLSWQDNFVAQGNASSAVGRYQIINTTLKSLVNELDLDTTQKFDPNTQDQLAIKLIERRGAVDYVSREISPETFAANLSREWAALPRVIGDNPHASYYDGDGLNKSRTKVKEVLEAIKPISAE